MPLESWVRWTTKARKGKPYFKILEDPTSLNTHISLKLHVFGKYVYIEDITQE